MLPMLRLRVYFPSTCSPRPPASRHCIGQCRDRRNERWHGSTWDGSVVPRGYHSQAVVHDPFKILYLGRDEFSCAVLDQLYQARDVWQELAIVTTPDMKVGRRGSELAISPLKVLGHQLNLPVHFVPPGKDKNTLNAWQPPSPFSEIGATPPPSHIIITASFGRILPKSVLELFLPNRRINVHPSLLPEYRGASPIQHVIADGRRETGVSVVGMLERSKGIDAGEIWGQKRASIPEGVAFADLRDNLAQAGGKLLVSVLRDMITGKATSRPQPDNPAAPRAPLFTSEDAIVDFETMTAEHIARRSRAFSHQKPPLTALKSQRVLQLHSVMAQIDSADVLRQLPAPGTAIYDRSANALLVRCASDTILSVAEVKQQNRALLKAKEWWNGVRPELRLQGGDEGPVQFLRPALPLS